jgi:Co/Zn/Cd efflux system component
MMRANLPLALAAVLASLGGLALLYMKWKRGHHAEAAWRYAVGGGWMLLLVGAIAWTLAARDMGLTVAVLLVMIVVQLLIVERALPHLRGPRKAERNRERAAPSEPPRPGRISRAWARGLGSLLLAPTLSILACLIYRAWTPPPEINQAMGAVAAASLVWCLVLVVVLGVARPWRAVASLTATGVVGAALLFAPRALGA